MSPEEKVKIENRGYSSPCWIWQGALTQDGYGMAYDRKKSMPAHRAFYLRAKGRIPKGYDLDHLCRVKCCVNPDHLEVVTHQENVFRKRGTREERIAAIEQIPALKVILDVIRAKEAERQKGKE